MEKITDYLPEKILDSFGKYRPYIEEYFLFNTQEFIYGQKRDNCGVIAGGFWQFMESKGLQMPRVGGNFKNDIGVYKFLDFYKEDIEEMLYLGYNPKLEIDRKKFAKEYGLEERQKEIPHYWNKDEEGKIVDLSAYSQFVKTKLATDMNHSRYKKSNGFHHDKELGYIPQISQQKKHKMW